MGLIDDTGAAPAPATEPDAGGSDSISQLRAQFEQKVPDDQKDALQRIVLAGQKILYDKQTNTAVEQRMQAAKNPAAAAGSGAVELLGVLMRESRGTFPKQLIGPAVGILMTEILDYMKQTGRIDGTNEDFAAASKAMMEATLQKSGSSMDELLGKTEQAMSDPNIAAKMQQQMQGA